MPSKDAVLDRMEKGEPEYTTNREPSRVTIPGGGVTPHSILNAFVAKCASIMASSMNMSLKACGYLNTRHIFREEHSPYRVGFYDANVVVPASLLQQVPGLSNIIRPENYNSLVFPIETYFGSVMGVQFKNLVNTRQITTYVYPEYQDMYGSFFGFSVALPIMWSSEEVILVEGPIDALAVSKFRRDVLSILSSSVTQTMVKILKRFVRKVWLAFDNDEAGFKGTERALKLFSSSGITALPLDYGKKFKDPAEAIFIDETAFKSRLENL